METTLVGKQVTLNEEKQPTGFGQPVVYNKPRAATIVTLFICRNDAPKYTLLMEDGTLVEKNASEFKVNTEKPKAKAAKKR